MKEKEKEKQKCNVIIGNMQENDSESCDDLQRHVKELFNERLEVHHSQYMCSVLEREEYTEIIWFL